MYMLPLQLDPLCGYDTGDNYFSMRTQAPKDIMAGAQVDCESHVFKPGKIDLLQAF